MSCNNGCGGGIFGGNGDWIWIIIAVIVFICLCNDNNGGILGSGCDHDRDCC